MAATSPLFNPVLRAALWQFRLESGRARAWVLAVVALLVAAGFQRGAPTAALLSALALVWLGSALLYDLHKQNHPYLAQLVPGQLVQLRWASAGVLGVLSVAAGALMGLREGQPVAWAVAAALAMLVWGASLRWWWTWLIVGGLGGTAFWWTDSAVWGLLSAAIRLWHREQLPSLALAAAVVLPWLASRLPTADKSVRRSHFAAPDGRAEAWPQLSLASLSRWSAAVFSWLMPPWRALLLRRAQATPRSALARAELALYGSTHWSAQASTILVALLLTGIMFGALLTWTPVTWDQVRRGGAIGMSIGLLSACFTPLLLGQPRAVIDSRREQALLMLLPGMPRGAALNRALARRQMLQAGITSAVALLLPVAVLGARAWDIAALGVAVALPLSVGLWRDHARARLPGSGRMAIGFLLLGGALLALHEIAGWRSGAVLALGLLLWCGLMVWRWPQLKTWPQALPAAREPARTPGAPAQGKGAAAAHSA